MKHGYSKGINPTILKEVLNKNIIHVKNMDSGGCIGGHFVGEREYRVLRHIKLLKGNFSEYIENASDHVIDLIQNCCNAYLRGFYKCKRVEKWVWFDKPRKYIVKICDPDLSRDEKRKILADPWVGGEIFSLLFGNVLPLLVSAYVK